MYEKVKKMLSLFHCKTRNTHALQNTMSPKTMIFSISSLTNTHWHKLSLIELYAVNKLYILQNTYE